MDAELTITHIKKVDKNSLLILETKDSKKILAYKYEKSGSTSIISIPDFSIVNFDIALQLHEKVLSSKKELIKNLNINNNSNIIDYSKSYIFTTNSSLLITTLFTSLECYINSLIPEEYFYTNEKQERINKSDIMKNTRFMDKINNVLPNIYNNPSFISITKDQNINLLEKTRDMLIHLKTDATGEHSKYILNTLLDFRYKECLNTVKNFMNYYKPNHIELCVCELNDHKDIFK